MPNIEHIKPAVLSKYDYFNVDGIDIYLWKSIRVDHQLKFVLKSLLFLEYVEVYGIKLM